MRSGLRSRSLILPAFMFVVLVGGLVAYKSAAAVRQIEYARSSGLVAVKPDVLSLETNALPLRIGARSVNYLAAIWPALIFGILISAAVRTYVPATAARRLLAGGPLRRQVVAAVSGAPLMLCSCCAAPLFSSAYERSRNLASSLALLMAAPALNPAAIVLTFLLFPAAIAWGRLWMSVVAVFLGTALVARLAPDARIGLRAVSFEDDDERNRSVTSFVRSCLHVTARTVPVILLGIAAAMLLEDRLQPHTDLSRVVRLWSIAATAAVAVPMALPTFFEIPLAVTLLASGAPAGAAAALLFAGPAVNLASLLTVGREAGWKAIAMVAGMVWLIAFVGGLAIG